LEDDVYQLNEFLGEHCCNLVAFILDCIEYEDEFISYLEDHDVGTFILFVTCLSKQIPFQV
jgi:hypothetical protein